MTGDDLQDFDIIPAAAPKAVTPPPGSDALRASPPAAGIPVYKSVVTDTTRSLDPSKKSVSFQASGILQYVPQSSTIDGTDFSDFLTAAHQNAAVTGVRLQPGSYQVLPDSTQVAHIRCGCQQQRTQPFEIDLSGSTLVYTDALVGGIMLEVCTAVTLHGPAILTYAQSQYPYAQGTIKSISGDNLQYTIQIHSDFVATWQRMLATFPNRESGGGVVYDPVTRLTLPPYRGGTDFVVDFSKTVRINANTYSVTLVRYPGIIFVNDLVVVTQPTDAVGIACDSCKDTTVRNFNLPTAAGFGFYDGTPTGGNSWLNLILAPSRVPGSDGQTPLMSAIHDGLHCTSGKNGPTVSNCQFANLGDDGIAIHGRFSTVAKVIQEEAVLILGAPILNPGELNAGDTITVYTPDARRLGTSSVVSVSVASAPVPPTTVDTVFGGDFSRYSYLRVVLMVWEPGFVGMPVGSFVSPLSRNGNNYVITNNLIYNSRGRGCIVRAAQGLIQGNNIIHMTDTSIHMAPGLDFSRESGFSENMLVRDNYLEGEQQGILLGANTLADSPFIYGDNFNVRFINNTIVGSQTAPFTATTAAKIVVQDTRFINVLCSALVDNTRAYYWQVQKAAMQLANVYGVTFSGNSLIFNGLCKRSQTNLNTPVYLVNVTHVVGTVKPTISVPGSITIGTAAVSSFQAAPKD